MSNEDWIAAALDDALLTLDELCRLVEVPAPWVQEHVEQGLLPTRPAVQGAPAAIDTAAVQWRFDAVALARARRILCLERDFDAAPELAALVVDLEDEIARLRTRLRRAGLG